MVMLVWVVGYAGALSVAGIDAPIDFISRPPAYIRRGRRLELQVGFDWSRTVQQSRRTAWAIGVVVSYRPAVSDVVRRPPIVANRAATPIRPDEDWVAGVIRKARGKASGQVRTAVAAHRQSVRTVSPQP